MKTGILSIIVLFTIHVQLCFSQNEKITHTFKIVGKSEAFVITGIPEKTAVEYDPNNANHLFVTKFNKEGLPTSKTHYHFLGKRFELPQIIDYILKKQLISDGLHISYRENGSIEKEQTFKNGILQQITSYYPDGKKQLLSVVNDKILNGEYKMWYANGQLRFSGSYKDNLKDGEFQSFNESGAIVKEGIYKGGNLVSGDPVVLDVWYDHPDEPASYIDGDKAFDEYLNRRSAGLDGLKGIKKEKRIDLRLTVDKTGKITKIEHLTQLLPNEINILNDVFKVLPEFLPATVENIPVISTLNLNLILSDQGLKRNSKNQANTKPIQMPGFHGGEYALSRYITTNLKYPPEAVERKIEGKVYVRFIINEDGTISNVTLARGVQYLLDKEAMRVIEGMPKWNPATQDGKPVKVCYTVPVNFILKDSTEQSR